jgi:hypothetical protein
MRAWLPWLLLAGGCGKLLGLDEFGDRAETTSATSSSTTSSNTASGSVSSTGIGASGGEGGMAGGGSGGTAGAAGCGGCAQIDQYVFASEAHVTPLIEFTSVAEANALCNGWATTAGLPGVFKAWVSEGSLSAAANLEGSGMGWCRCDGAFVTLDPANPGIALNAAISLNEYGQDVTGYVWTGTHVDGMVAATCADWKPQGPTDQGTVGLVTQTDANWTDTGVHDCDSIYRLYCFQVSP